MEIEPLYDKIGIAFFCDENYIKYASVTIQSLINVSSSSKKYDIVVITSCDCSNINEYVNGKENISIRMFNINDLINVSKYHFYESAHISKTAYYRLFIPKIMEKYELVLYMDCDMIAKKNIDEYLNVNRHPNILGVVEDFYFFKMLRKNDKLLPKKYKTTHDYYKQELDIEPEITTRYFNSGLLFFNIQKCIDFNLTEKCFELMNKNDFLFCHDQDLLNSVCKNNIDWLPQEMNVILPFVSSYGYNIRLPRKNMLVERDEYQKVYDNAYVLHYCGPKTWVKPSYDYSLALNWWNVVKDMPKYKEGIYFSKLSKTIQEKIVNMLSTETINKFLED